MNAKLRRGKAAEILLAVSKIVSSSLDLKKVGELVLKESMEVLSTDHASLFLTDDESHLVLTEAAGFSADEIDNIKLLGSWEVINKQLVRQKKSLIVNDVSRNAIFKGKSLPFSGEKLPVKSFLAVPLDKDGRIIGALIVSNRTRPGHLFSAEDEKLLRGLSYHIATALLNAKLYQNLKDLFISTVKSLVRAIDAKDKYTGGHSERVMRYALAIGREMKLDEEKLENLGLSSLLHDVGKIGIKEHVLGKEGKLTLTERNNIMNHPTIGVGIVGTINDSAKIIRGIKEHHEKFDGTGYPDGLKGKEISLEGRIIALADTYDALTTTRPYQKKYSKKGVFFEIRRSSSTQFDPKVVKAFMISFSKHPDVWGL